MSTPQTNTKIERVVEGIESLTLAVVANTVSTDAAERLRTFTDVEAARAEVKEALADFIRPVLRAVA